MGFRAPPPPQSNFLPALSPPFIVVHSSMSHRNTGLSLVEEDGTAWPMMLVHHGSATMMSGGWMKFVQAHNLDVGDQVTFEAVATAQLKVTVQRCTDPKIREELKQRHAAHVAKCSKTKVGKMKAGRKKSMAKKTKSRSATAQVNPPPPTVQATVRLIITVRLMTMD